ncbi:MAG: molybdopterin-binding protein [Aigarchaeota archaeon]|nr:molybdopterin-binding protein [Aigarchaeota archaeon]MDW7985802.1 molybdopterin-binding protein [Nitrososphaerota archaeon]
MWSRFSDLKQTLFELITVGYEILDGRILNTNSKWLAEKITSMGGRVTRMVTVGDSISDISSSIKDALKRGVDWIITSGGLGPTYDDMTLQGVAKAVNRRLVLNRKAYEMVRERYRKLAEEGVVKSPELTPSRLKMAMLPRGSKPLHNKVGSAPGVLLKHGRTYIACLPGVPAELYSIFEEELEPIIIKTIKKVYRVDRVLNIKGIVESSLAPKIEEIIKKYLGIYVKSHPKSVEAGVSRIELQISAIANKEERALKKVEEIEKLIREVVVEMGGEVEL